MKQRYLLFPRASKLDLWDKPDYIWIVTESISLTCTYPLIRPNLWIWIYLCWIQSLKICSGSSKRSSSYTSILAALPHFGIWHIRSPLRLILTRGEFLLCSLICPEKDKPGCWREIWINRPSMSLTSEHTLPSVKLWNIKANMKSSGKYPVYWRNSSGNEHGLAISCNESVKFCHQNENKLPPSQSFHLLVNTCYLLRFLNKRYPALRLRETNSILI